jgi:ABC-2 type transport system permease protein
MKALYWKEIRSFLGSVIGYIFIVIFLVFTGIMLWLVSGPSNLLEGEEADMIPFFNVAPYVLCVLIPAITIFTRPITDLQIILAKYFAGVTLLLISLLPTLIYYYSMVSLGVDAFDENGVAKTVIDEGATFTSYLGLILLGSSLIAIGIFSSAITSNQIVSFIIAMFLCWLFYDGFDQLGSFNLMGDFDYVFQYLGLWSHYASIKKGVIDTSDLIYFFGMIAIFLAATLTVVKSLKR